MRTTLEIDDDDADRIVIAALRRSRRILKTASPGYGDERELLAAMTRIIEYYSPQ